MNRYQLAFITLTLAGTAMVIHGMRWQDVVVSDQVKPKVELDQEAVRQISNSYSAKQLFKAIDKNLLDAITSLIKENPNLVHARDFMNNTPLMHALQFGKGRIVQLLLQAGADIEARDDLGGTAIAVAASFNPKRFKDWDDIDPLDVLLSAGANIDVVNKFGSTPLYRALPAGYVPHIQKLIEAGADIYKRIVDPDLSKEEYQMVVEYAEILSRGVNYYIYPAVIFSVTPKEMDSIVASMIALSKRKVIGTKDAGSVVIKKLYQALLKDKIALAQKYHRRVTQQQIDAGKNMLRESFNRALKNPHVQQKVQEIMHATAESTYAGVEPMDRTD